MARIEKIAYGRGASEEVFMERAGAGVADCVQRFIAEHHLKPKILLLCGKGNNGGDAYVAGRILIQGDFHVEALASGSLDDSSPLCQLQAKRFREAGGKIAFPEGKMDFGDATLLVDALFGTGFHGKAQGMEACLIAEANASGLPILSVDIPSGLGGQGEVICASKTLFLGLPKSHCFVGNVWNDVGQIEVFDFGLGEKEIEEAQADFILLEEKQISLPKIVRTRHKYQAGYVVGLGGSFGMPGAPIMAGIAALRAGAGIVRLLHPRGMEAEFSGAPPELVRQGYEEAQGVLEAMKKAQALFVGPGIGLAPATAQVLKKVLEGMEKPCVIDAEALTLIAEHDFDLPKNAILTPHHGEMMRLLHLQQEITPQEMIEKSHAYAQKKGVTVVLKGAPTFIFHPGTTPHVCPRGDPGMATAGAGDVLTGIISALLAQGQTPFEGALTGVFLHALAGEKAAGMLTSYSIIASDITQALPDVFKTLKGEKK